MVRPGSRLKSAGRRRAQRSVRVAVAGCLVGAAAVFVVSALATGTLIGVSAVFCLLAAGCAVRILHSEILQTKVTAAVRSAEQARRFQACLEERHRERQADVVRMRARLETERVQAEFQRARAEAQAAENVRLCASLEVTRQDADEARGVAEREARRARESQERLAAVLDEVFGTTGHDVDADRPEAPGRRDVVVDLASWGARAPA